MTVSDTIIKIDQKIEQNKAQYDLDSETAKISALSSKDLIKYEFLTGTDVLPKKFLLEKAAARKRFEYLPLGQEWKAQIDIVKKQYQESYHTYDFYEIIKK